MTNVSKESNKDETRRQGLVETWVYSIRTRVDKQDDTRVEIVAITLR